LIFESLRNDYSVVLGKFDTDFKSPEQFWFQGSFCSDGSGAVVVLGKFGADLKSLEVFWFQGSFFCRFSAMLGKACQQDGAKWTKLGPSWQQVAAKSCQDAAKIAS
jgi:hypothetical protein